MAVDITSGSQKCIWTLCVSYFNGFTINSGVFSKVLGHQLIYCYGLLCLLHALKTLLHVSHISHASIKYLRKYALEKSYRLQVESAHTFIPITTNLSIYRHNEDLNPDNTLCIWLCETTLKNSIFNYISSVLIWRWWVCILYLFFRKKKHLS